MGHDEFIGKVQNYARLPSRGAAELATRAVLETLAERLSADEAKDTAAQLPQTMQAYLVCPQPSQRFGLDEFFRRVSEREGAKLPDAVYHARAVIHVLQEAVTPGQIADVRGQLPAEYDRLFEAGVEGQM